MQAPKYKDRFDVFSDLGFFDEKGEWIERNSHPLHMRLGDVWNQYIDNEVPHDKNLFSDIWYVFHGNIYGHKTLDVLRSMDKKQVYELARRIAIDVRAEELNLGAG